MALQSCLPASYLSPLCLPAVGGGADVVVSGSGYDYNTTLDVPFYLYQTLAGSASTVYLST